MTVVQHKSLTKRFWGISLDESDLSRIASIVREATKEFDGDLQIEILSGDGEDTLRSSDPDLFFDKTLPQLLSEVKISYRHYNAPLNCDLAFAAGMDGRAEISVDGENTTVVAGLFRELDREVSSRQRKGAWVTQNIDGFLLDLFISYIAAAAIYSAFGFGLHIADVSFNSFKESETRSVIEGASIFFTFIGFFIGGAYIKRVLKRCLPPVSFHGHIVDKGQGSRYAVKWVITFLFIPILLNVLASIISELLK